MRFGGKVDHMGDIVARKQRPDRFPIADIRAHEYIVVALRDIGNVSNCPHR